MIVAVIFEKTVSEIIEYPYATDIDEIRPNFFDDTVLIELNEKPEVKPGYILKHNGTDFYYEKVEEPETANPEPSQLDRIETALNELTAGSVSTSSVDEAITEGVNDV